MSKENPLLSKDHSGQILYFDYPVNLNNETPQEDNNGRAGFQKAKKKLTELARRAKLIFTNGHR